MNWGVGFPGHNKVKAVMERHPAIVQEHQTDSCLPCQNVTAKNPQTRGRRKGTGAPRQQPAPLRPGLPRAAPDDSERTHLSKTEGVPPGYMYIHTPLPSARVFNPDQHDKDCMRDKDFIPDLLTDEGPSTG